LRVAVASSFIPFTRGGDTVLVDGLVEALRRRGHEVETIMLPFWPDPEQMVEQMLAYRLLDVSDAGERLIAVRTPSYLLRHPSKVVWFIHHHRPAYDLWETPWGNDPSGEGDQLREAIMGADHLYLREARAVFTNSAIVGERLLRFNAISSRILHPPLPESARYREGPFGDVIFAPGRLAPTKRQELLVRAMGRVRSPVRLVLAGPPDQPEHEQALRKLIDELNVHDRVELRAGWIPESDKQQLLADCLACAYIPYDEDSYGFVTLEAFASHKPVITCNDSGGTLELVHDRETGLVTEPDPDQLAAAFDTLYDNRELAAQLGAAGHAHTRTLAISWDTVVQRLLA
jgi:glycosyltransferase involved in cell wall biosynthesis